MSSKPELFSATIGDTLHIYDRESTPIIQKRIARALSKGDLVIHEDGHREWLETIPLHDPRETGSKEFVWDKSGDRIRCKRVRHTITDGVHETEEMPRRVFRSFDVIFN